MRKKKFLLTLAALLTFVSLWAQDTTTADTLKPWKLGGQGSLTFSQIYFDNWSAGGKNSVAGLATINFFGNYIEGKHSWENTLDFNLGFNQQGKGSVEKTDDRIEFNSIYGYKASKRWNYSALFNFKTQLFEGFDPENSDSLISSGFAPAYINFAIGMDYKPTDYFSAFLSPVNNKITMVYNDTLSNRGTYGVDPGSNVKYEFGAIVRFTFDKEVVKNVTLKSKLELFSNYIDHPEKVDVDWESVFNMKINEFLTTNFILHIKYDQDISLARQLKQVFGLGITYKI